MGVRVPPFAPTTYGHMQIRQFPAVPNFVPSQNFLRLQISYGLDKPRTHLMIVQMLLESLPSAQWGRLR